jgi:hypothetical protein
MIERIRSAAASEATVDSVSNVVNFSGSATVTNSELARLQPVEKARDVRKIRKMNLRKA